MEVPELGGASVEVPASIGVGGPDPMVPELVASVPGTTATFSAATFARPLLSLGGRATEGPALGLALVTALMPALVPALVPVVICL